MVTEKRNQATDAPEGRAPARAKKVITLVIALAMVLVLGAGLTVYFGDRVPIGAFWHRQPAINPALVGAWDYEGFEPYYVFNADGTGQRLIYDETMRLTTEDILWGARNGFLSICWAPEYCGDLRSCSAPEQWDFTFADDTFTIYSRQSPGVSHTYTRGNVVTFGNAPPQSPMPGGRARSAALVGAWNWEGFEPYYVFNADGTGQMLFYDEDRTTFMADIHWSVKNGILSICSTPEHCGDLHSCYAPAQWNITLEGDVFTVYSRWAPGLSYTYTRARG
jgi:hypothetical protein